MSGSCGTGPVYFLYIWYMAGTCGTGALDFLQMWHMVGTCSTGQEMPGTRGTWVAHVVQA